MPRHDDGQPRPNATPSRATPPGAGAGASSPATLMPVIAGAGLLLIALGLISTIGESYGPVTGLVRVLEVLARAGAVAAVYILSGVGLARAARPLYRDASDPIALQLGLGLSIQLTLSHLLGVLGLLDGMPGRAITSGLAALGLGLLAHQILTSPAYRRWLDRGRAGPTNEAPTPKSQRAARWVVWFDLLILSPGIAILLVAACSPPGWLWDSEFGGFDALSYHLQLPQEWLINGRLWPVDHNVYSYLPSYMEAAFLHLAALTGAPAKYAADGSPLGLLAGDGWRALSCQLLHAQLGLVAAWLTARLARRALVDLGFAGVPVQAASRATGMLVLLTPWTQVVGSLAYNELGVLALFAAAMLAAWDRGLAPARRGIVAAWLVGIACGVKPTALMFCAPPVAAVLITTVKPKDWARAALPGIAAGLIALSPWLIRNYLASGNPVFPAATSIFGTGHWTAEQAARFAAGHQFAGSIANRFHLLVLPEPLPPGASPDAGIGIDRYRGLIHPQWSLFPLLLLIGAVGSLAAKPTRRAGLLLTAGIVLQIAAWLFTTHLQSRFLLPLLIPGAALFGLTIAIITRAGRSALDVLSKERLSGVARPPSPRTQLLTIALLFSQAPLAIQSLLAIRVFAAQQREPASDGRRAGPAHPNAALLGGPGQFSGTDLREARSSMPPDEWAQIATSAPTLMLNLSPPGEPVLLLGESTPFYFTIPIRYTTTWDTNPLGQAMREHPDDPAAWTRSLFPSGTGLVLVNFGEIARLQRSGWYDPLVTPDAVARWLQAQGRPIHQWPEQSRVLARVSTAPTLPSASPGPAPTPLPPATPAPSAAPR